uniref:Si:ch211-39a7.1 n=1 Tax=Astyanax mexicanus TaxID=7994 RepID=A0A8B9M021_ASTMX
SLSLSLFLYLSLALSLSSSLCLSRALLKNLLKDYNPMERPVANDSQPLTVVLSLSLVQIMDVVSLLTSLCNNCLCLQRWYDHYLQWNQSEYPGVKNLRFTTDQIWTPDILLYNSADDEFDSTFKTNVLVNSSGYCNYLPPGIFMSTCNVDVRWFPFDIQKCELKFGSWTFDGWLLDLQMSEADISGYMPNGEWDLVGVPGSRNEIFYDCCKEPYPDVTFVVTIRRRTLYYALNLLIPCVLLSSMTLLIFLLPADSGEKISLGITVLLSLTVFMLLVAEIMPATSDSIPLIGNYYFGRWIILSMALIRCLFLFCLFYPQVQLVLLQWVAWFLRMKRPGEGEDPERPPCAPHLRRCSSGSHSGSIPNSNSVNNNGNLLYIGFSRGGGGCSCSGASGGGDPQLQVILDEVRFIADRFRAQDENESVADQWKFAAAVIDRLCLVAFSVFNIICTISILMSAPNFVEAVSKDFI